MAYTAAGLSPDGSSTYYLPRLIGERRARELMLTNRRLSAAEAESWGLVNRVVADDALMDEAQALAASLSNGPTKAYGMVKKLLVQTFNESLETQMEIEGRGISDISRTEDAKAGIRAFLNKEKPVFEGR
jgi:2-(1,2-epoxy-1,2-dihydrophenyl)acetyl-CoA isomerase